MQEKFRTFQVGKDMDPNFKFEFILKWQKKKSNNFPISLQFIQFILQLVRIMTTLAFTY